jgi:ABC-type glycerol-3-phosphate transport system substrate-binding protein
MKKAMLILICAALVGLPLFAGGGKDSGAAGSKKPVVQAWIGGDDNPARPHYYEGFRQAYPQYEFEVIPIGDGQEIKVLTRLAVEAGNAPDVFILNAGETLMEYVDGGYLYDLTDAFNQRKWADRHYPDFVNANSRNGRVYAMSQSNPSLWQTLYYNKTWLDSKGITVPATVTVDQFVTLSNQVKAAGMQPISFGNVDGWPAILLIGDYLLQSSDPTLIDRLNAGTAHWDTSPEARSAVEAMVKLAQGGCFVTGWESQNTDAEQEIFLAQRAAFMYIGSWWLGNNQIMGNSDNAPFKIGTVTLPLINANTSLKGAQYFADMVIVINAKAKNVQGSLDLIDFLTTDAAARYAMEGAGQYSYHPTANRNPTLDPLMKTEAFTKQLDLPKMGYMDHAFPNPVIETMKIDLVKAMTGVETLDQCLKNIEASHASLRGR